MSTSDDVKKTLSASLIPALLGGVGAAVAVMVLFWAAGAFSPIVGLNVTGDIFGWDVSGQNGLVLVAMVLAAVAAAGSAGGAYVGGLIGIGTKIGGEEEVVVEEDDDVVAQ